MKLLLYCTKAKPYLYKTKKPMIEKKFEDYHTQLNEAVLSESLNGKIVAECDFEVERIDYRSAELLFNRHYLEVLDKSCLTDKQMYDYLKGEKGYAIHIKNLHIFDKPKELSEYYSRAKKMNTFDWYNSKGYEWVCESIDKAPQNMMYALNKKQNKEYILISIQPQWVCKILNGEKTIEVRKKVLKEMLKLQTNLQRNYWQLHNMP